mgnify:CR=1 FL=1
MSNQIKVISKHTTCGIVYVQVEMKHGISTKFESEVNLLNALYATGLNEIGTDAIMDLVESYVIDSMNEAEIEWQP